MLYYLIAPFGVKSPPFTYKAESNYKKGTLVEIPLKEKVVLGVVLGVVAKPSFECKEIARQKGYFDKRQIELAEFVAYYYYAGLGEAYNLMQPHYFSDGNSSLGSQFGKSSHPASLRRMSNTPHSQGESICQSTTANTRIVRENGGKDFRENNPLSLADGARGRVKSSLESIPKSNLDSNTKLSLYKNPQDSRGNPQNNAIDCHADFDKSVRNDSTTCEGIKPEVSQSPYCFNLNPLSKAQQQALDFIATKSISLLFGDTGSGKSEIYFHHIASTLTQGKTALFLMPEISLTPQIEHRLKSAFGEQIGIWHSKVSTKSKKEILEKLESKTIKIIAGARSTLFLPIHNLGLIIVDEEHDEAYKSFENPRYNARDCALYLAKKSNLQVVLGSATPSVVSYYLAKKGGYLYRLKGVFFENAKKQYILENAATSLSQNLLSHIKSTLDSKKQAIIFVPTRANFKALLCKECGYSYTCPFCSVNMSLHIKKNCLICHYCGYAQIIPKSCQQCKSNDLSTKRIGTQQIADELQEKFANAKIGIFDKDHITTNNKLNKALSAFRNGEIDILVGTQMLSKGHDYHNVELAVVLGIDYVLNGGDFRSFERGFALLYQIAGRSGRKNEGKVFIQSLRIDWIKSFLNDYEEFLEWELRRRSKNYPPFKKLVMIHCTHARIEKAKEQIEEIVSILKPQKKIHIIGYGSSAIERIANKWRFHILLNGDKISDILESLNVVQNTLESNFIHSKSIAPKIYAKIHNTNHNITHSTNNNASPQKWVESTQKSNPTSNYKNTNSQKALIIAKRFDVDIDCLDTL